MKTAIRLFLIFAVCGALALPGAAMADEFKVIGKLKMGPGNHGQALGMDKGAKSLSISMVNGSGPDRIKVASAKVKVNGQELFGPNEFSAGNAGKVASIIKTFEVTADLSVVNLDVEVKGKKGSEITLTVTGVYEEAAPPVVLVIYFMDGDGDGVGGDITMPGDMGSPPPGNWVLIGGDCNDIDPTSIFPGDPGCMF